MAFTTQDLANLDNAISSGAKRVKYRDREVEYNSLTDMLALRAVMQNELAQNTGIIRQLRVATDKGFSGSPSPGADGGYYDDY
jgi:hypothetical protein